MKGTKGWFQPGNTMWQKCKATGRPEFWTQEIISDLIDDLEEWSNKDSSICMAGFRCDRFLNEREIKWVREKSPEFTSSYESARSRVANRLAEKTGKKISQAVFNKYAAVYDMDLKAHEKEMLQVKAKAEEDAKSEAAAEARKSQEMIFDQLKRSDLKSAETNIKAEHKS